MDKPLACFEISSQAVRLLIGYELSDGIVVVYTKEEKGSFLNPDGTLKDANGLIETLRTFQSINDENAKLHITIQEVCLLLPSCGLSVYTSQKSTVVVSPDYKVAKLDITNVLTQINKEMAPAGISIVDIIPDDFILDDGQRRSEPPLGLKSRTLAIQAKVFGLPTTIVHGYKSAVERAGFRVKQCAVAAYSYAELHKTYKDLPESYLLVDIGSDITTVSLIGKCSPYRAFNFARGGASLTEKIASSLRISLDAAERLKCRFGYDDRRISYNPPIVTGKNEKGVETQYFQQDLNQAIVEWVDDYLPHLNAAIDTTLKNMGNGKDSLPILFTGGASRLNGLLKILKNHFQSRKLLVVTPRSIGARESKWSPLLGLVRACSHYRGSLEDGTHGVISVSRGDANNDGGKKGARRLKVKPSRDEDEII